MSIVVGRMRRWRPKRLRDVPPAMWWAAAPGAVFFAFLQVRGYWQAGTLGLDSHAYWVAAREPSQRYEVPMGYTDAYLYSPVFAQVLRPLGLLPWPAFGVLWAVAGGAAMCWLLAPLGVLRGVVVGLFLLPDLLIGNIYTFFALALVLSVRGYGGVLALPLLTKVIPGMVGLWHMLRGEWRCVAWAAGVTAALVGASVAASPDEWRAWITFLGRSSGEGWSPLRVGVALVLVVVAARSGIAWLLAPAMMLCRPLVLQFAILAVLAAIPRLRKFSVHDPLRLRNSSRAQRLSAS